MERFQVKHRRQIRTDRQEHFCCKLLSAPAMLVTTLTSPPTLMRSNSVMPPGPDCLETETIRPFDGDHATHSHLLATVALAASMPTRWTARMVPQRMS